jgi:cytoskeletal protein RodZ
MLSVGETLKCARLKQGLDLSTVAAQTKISAKYLEAIESDDRKMLPSGFFYRSFVEQYAKSLSLDTREIDAQIDRVLGADEPLPLPGFASVVARNVPSLTSAHRFQTRRSYTSIATLILVVVGCSAVYTWWHSARSSMNLKGMIASVRALAKPTVVQTTTTIVNAKVDKASSKVTAVSPTPPGARNEPALPPPVPDSAAPGVATAAVSSDDKTPDSNSDGYKSADYKVLLDLMAREATWLSVSSDGRPVFSGILQANQTKTVGGKQFAKMRVGNAAGIDVRLNGKLLGPLGAHGQVLTVLFTPDKFQIFAPPKEGD